MVDKSYWQQDAGQKEVDADVNKALEQLKGKSGREFDEALAQLVQTEMRDHPYMKGQLSEYEKKLNAGLQKQFGDVQIKFGSGYGDAHIVDKHDKSKTREASITASNTSVTEKTETPAQQPGDSSKQQPGASPKVEKPSGKEPSDNTKVEKPKPQAPQDNTEQPQDAQFEQNKKKVNAQVELGTKTAQEAENRGDYYTAANNYASSAQQLEVFTRNNAAKLSEQERQQNDAKVKEMRAKAALDLQRAGGL